LGLAINQYIYVSALLRPAFLRHKFTISYSQLEHVASIDDIVHPAIRAAFQELRFTQPIDIATLATLPSQSGLGSSASFMVGLLNLLYGLQERKPTKLDLAIQAIRIEREVLNHVCGVQDQLHAAFGGWNCFEFEADKIRQRPLLLREETMKHILGSMLLVFTGLTRSAPTVLGQQMEWTRSGALDAELEQSYHMVHEALKILEHGSSTTLEAFGDLLHQAWLIKRKLSNAITTTEIDELYERGREAGALGGKLCGAGGGGFMLFIVPERVREKFLGAFDPTRIVPVDIDTGGTTILKW
jgi:D-glycero-alpha-D-manno-heptose-7-phosphate kinase